MSAFHKPKVYRSLEGCCICKVKSSSSRFTDSGKYSGLFASCFRLSEESLVGREGDICNACVLLVKRYRKLPKNSDRHWAHVVDARAGPGVKNFVKVRRREHCRERLQAATYKRKHVYRKKRKEVPTRLSEDSNLSDNNSLATALRTALGAEEPRVSDFIDLNVFKRRKTCCGSIFVGPGGEAIVDPRFLHPCTHRPILAEPISAPNSSVIPLPKLADSLMTIESIIESELIKLDRKDNQPAMDLSSSSSSSLTSSSSLASSPTSSSSSSPDPETDEGFFDKPSVSPTIINIMDGQARLTLD